MRSTYPVRVRRRSRRLGCLVLGVGAIVLLAVIGARSGRNWGVPTLPPRPTATAVPSPAESLGAIPVADTPPPAPTPDLYRQWVHEARELYPYPDSEERMIAVMLCESGGDPTTISPDGINHGLFQYNEATWAGDWNPYRDGSIYDARTQIFATACAWSRGMQTQWGCYTSAPR